MSLSRETLENALRRGGWNPHQIADFRREQVLAVLPDDAMWTALAAASPSDYACARVGLSTLDHVTAARPRTLIVDLRAFAVGRAAPVTGLVRDAGAGSVIVWCPFARRNSAAVLDLQTANPIEIVWRGIEGERDRLRWLLRLDGAPSACALVGHRTALDIAALPVDIRHHVLAFMGGAVCAGKSRAFSKGLDASHRTIERRIRRSTAHTLGTLVFLLRHAAAWDHLLATGSVARAAERGGYRSARAYADAFRNHIGVVPSQARSTLPTASVVGTFLDQLW